MTNIGKEMSSRNFSKLVVGSYCSVCVFLTIKCHVPLVIKVKHCKITESSLGIAMISVIVFVIHQYFILHFIFNRPCPPVLIFRVH